MSPVQSITPILNVTDIGHSFEWFEKLGWRRGFSWNSAGLIGNDSEAAAENEHGPADFGSVCTDKVTIFLCLGAQGSQGTVMPGYPGDDKTDGVWMSWWLDEKQSVDSMHQIAVDNGMIVTYPPTQEPWEVYEFHLRHPDGHMFRVGCGA